MFGGWDLLASFCLLENTHKVGADVRYSLLLICAHGRIRSNLETFCKNTVLLVTTMDSVVKTLSY